MYHRWAALALVLALWSLAPESAAGQSTSVEQQPRGRKSGTLGHNYPNPFNQDTRIPFSLACSDTGTGEHVVSIRIYNVLAQLVAVPVVEGRGEPLDGIRLPCGDYLGYWNGKVKGSRRDAPSGIYTYELLVDGERSTKKMFISR